MKKIIIILTSLPFILSSQQISSDFNNYFNTTNNAYNGNIFFHVVSEQGRPMKIYDKDGAEKWMLNQQQRGADFKLNYNNKISFYDRASKGFFIMDSLENIIDSVYCKNGYNADFHDFLALPNGNYVLFAYDNKPYALDTVISGFPQNTIVTGAIIQELDSNHNLIFEWKSWDHFQVTDNQYLSSYNPQSPIDYVHINSIEIDFDGHFLISSRHLDEITKIHRTTGEIIWRLGGKRNQFSFVNDYPFSHQHTVKSLGDSKYLLFDNGNYSSQFTGTNNYSRAVEYYLDTTLMTATKIWEYIHPDSLYSDKKGGLQRLPNGNTLITFAEVFVPVSQITTKESRIVEVDTNNSIVHEFSILANSTVYRVQKYNWFFYEEVLGCIDSLACNYNPLANTNDNSCCYSYSSTTTVIDCDSFFWNGNNILNSGSYSNNFINLCGCDSTINLELILNYSDSVYITDSSNNSYEWNGNTYTISGNYQQTLTNQQGCDSIINLELIINNGTEIVENTNSKDLFKIINIIGQQNFSQKNSTMLYLYKNGRVEKKIILR